jgi:hypothetical protein
MPERGSFIFSAGLHVAVVLMLLFGLPHLFERKIAEDQPIAVQLVNIAPETHATQTNPTPPVPDAKPEIAQAEPPKPQPPKPQPKPEPPKAEPPKPEPPKPQPPPPPPPVPPPVEKPQPPKPAPPPPPPPAPKPPAPKAKPDDTSFDQLLKNLANRKPAPQEQQAEGPKRKSSQPIAPLAAQLSTSEIDLVKQQIEACWNVPAGARDAENLRPEFRVQMNQDGTVRAAQLLNPDPTNPFFQAAADSANRALLNPRCQPLKLPPEKYDQWQTFTITFDPKDIT